MSGWKAKHLLSFWPVKVAMAHYKEDVEVQWTVPPAQVWHDNLLCRTQSALVWDAQLAPSLLVVLLASVLFLKSQFQSALLAMVSFQLHSVKQWLPLTQMKSTCLGPALTLSSAVALPNLGVKAESLSGFALTARSQSLERTSTIAKRTTSKPGILTSDKRLDLSRHFRWRKSTTQMFTGNVLCVLVDSLTSKERPTMFLACVTPCWDTKRLSMTKLLWKVSVSKPESGSRSPWRERMPLCATRQPWAASSRVSPVDTRSLSSIGQPGGPIERIDKMSCVHAASAWAEVCRSWTRASARLTLPFLVDARPFSTSCWGYWAKSLLTEPQSWRRWFLNSLSANHVQLETMRWGSLISPLG